MGEEYYAGKCKFEDRRRRGGENLQGIDLMCNKEDNWNHVLSCEGNKYLYGLIFWIRGLGI
jgi:hypothetical protein